MSVRPNQVLDVARSSARAWFIAAAIAAVAWLWFGALGSRSLFDPDEGRYAEIPREMLNSGDWVIPRLNGLVYLEKPPLQYWLTALSFRWLGETEFAARLCTGMAGFASLLVVFFLGRSLWGLQIGLRAVLLSGASALFVLMGHQLTLDMLLSLWLLAALACFLMAQSRRDDVRQIRLWMLGCWISMALAVLTKGMIGVIVPAATLLIYVWWQRDTRALRELGMRWGVPAFLLLAAPWYILASRANPDFLRFFFVREHFQRFLTPIEHRVEPWWFFLVVLAVGIFPWLPHAVAGAAAMRREHAACGQFDPRRVLWVWCLFIFLFFSFSSSKLIPYVLPLVPALALLCASRQVEADPRLGLTAAALSIIAGIAILVFAQSSGSNLKIAAIAAQVRWPVTWIGLGLSAAASVAGILSLRRQAPAAMALLCIAWFFLSFSVLAAAKKAEQLFSARDVALELDSTDMDAAPVFSVQLYDQSLAFYLRRPVVLVDYRDEFSLGLDQEPDRGIATLTEFAARWRALPEGYAVMRPRTRDALLNAGLPLREIAHIRNRVIVSRR